jgi:hypothetical protein
VAASILSAGPTYRVMTESDTYDANTERAAVKLALSISQAAQCEVRVLDDQDNILIVALPPAKEGSL